MIFEWTAYIFFETMFVFQHVNIWQIHCMITIPDTTFMERKNLNILFYGINILFAAGAVFCSTVLKKLQIVFIVLINKNEMRIG